MLDAKLESENIVLETAQKLGITGIIVRPGTYTYLNLLKYTQYILPYTILFYTKLYHMYTIGRLIGAPFTNFDLAKLFNVTQKEEKRGLAIDTRDILNGDVDRSDVADVISRLLSVELPQKLIKFSVINTPGSGVSEYQWGELLSLFTVPAADLATSRAS